MALNIDVTKSGKENNMSLLRRFSSKARGIGFAREIRNRRFFVRDASKLRRKQSAIARLEARDRYNELVKSGRIQPGRRR